MLNKNTTVFKNIGLGLIFLFGIVSCEKDLEDIAIDLVGNDKFSVGKELFDVVAYNIDINSSRVDNNGITSSAPLSLLGVHKDNNFGHMKSAIISQVFMSIAGRDFGNNPTIDLVVLDIPYYATKDGNQDATDPVSGEVINDDEGNPIQVPNFELDSVYGNKTQEFNIKVHELGTFLNVLDPDNPSKKKSYYSDKDYTLKDQLFLGNFKLNRNDTVLYVNRELVIIGKDDDDNPIHDVDTIKATNLAPSMKFYLDKEFFKNRFVEHQNPSDFESNGSFTKYFRGLYIDANGADGALINVAGTNARISIYYTNEEIKDEGEDVDLNNNGVKGEKDVLVKTKQTMQFPFKGVRTGKYTRNYSGYPIENPLVNPDKVNGSEKLFVQGAGGSEAILDLFTDESLEAYRNKNWLINEANITIYIDGDQNEVPSRLFLYNYVYNSTLKDFKVSKINKSDVFGGKLEYDSEGKPEKYKFRITRFISDILNSDKPKEFYRFAIKNYSTTDDRIEDNAVLVDTIVSNYNWNPKGVVLKGNLPIENEKRIKLEIYYSKVKE